MKALILYFSGTGNTAYTAGKIRSILKEQAIATELHSTEEINKIQKDSFDILLLGCPKYYEYPVLDFIDFIRKKLPVNKKNIPTMIFCTQAGPLKTDFTKVERILKMKNYHLVVSKSFPIANNMVILDLFPLTGEEKRQENLKQLEQELKPLLLTFLAGKEQKEKTNILMRILSYLSAVLFTRFFPVFGLKYSPLSNCTGCGLCAKKCPKKNITLKNKKPVFGKSCIFCMRCINLCPVNAISYNKKKRSQYQFLDSDLK